MSKEDIYEAALKEIVYKSTHGDWIRQDEQHRRNHGGTWTRQQWIADIAQKALEALEAREADVGQERDRYREKAALADEIAGWSPAIVTHDVFRAMLDGWLRRYKAVLTPPQEVAGDE